MHWFPLLSLFPNFASNWGLRERERALFSKLVHVRFRYFHHPMNMCDLTSKTKLTHCLMHVQKSNLAHHYYLFLFYPQSFCIWIMAWDGQALASLRNPYPTKPHCHLGHGTNTLPVLLIPFRVGYEVSELTRTKKPQPIACLCYPHPCEPHCHSGHGTIINSLGNSKWHDQHWRLGN